MKILVTGCAGFIGMHTCLRLLARGAEVVGIDNLNDYYDVQLKNDRLAQLSSFENFSFFKLDMTDQGGVETLFARHHLQRVVHLAAQPGVRYSIKNPHAYIQSNLVGFANILEGCRHHKIEHLVFSSSSSIYGANTAIPFSTNQNVDHPVSLYAATKKAGELIAHSYSHLYGLPATCLRLFTVYGPWGRPDMSPSLFTKAILEGKPIDVFNHGKMQRDFTYIDDIVEGIVRVLDKPATPDPAFDTANPDPSTSYAPYRIYNIGNHQPVELMAFIEAIENALGKKAIKNLLPMQAGDVVTTFAETSKLRDEFGFTPSTSLQKGVGEFVKWYINYHDSK
ncbi:MAG: protein CapI [Omnitrophica WOR_2 bacterium RIFCSPLOWO2_12_FULL_51_8]|nr:MAG: protein CapI [Omnitrophica WOR_2 bacterium RIFCSPLOWO2_12_FULL_51_8]